MRLTLRTLLAYLDDTLDPAQARQIGQKVAESEFATELIERIRRATRKRSLTVPPNSGPDRADPNTSAEYLDNDLAPDKVEEIERQALQSEVHLAEIAACHQLLTLILSEPAQVPPTARQRMYALAKGPEVDPARKAPRVASATMTPELAAHDDGETSVMVSRRGGTKRLTAAAILAGLLVVVVAAALLRGSNRPAPLKPGNALAMRPPIEPEKAKEPEMPKETHKPKDADRPADPPKDKEPEKSKEPEMPKDTDKPKEPPTAPAPPPDLATERRTSDARKEVGKATTGFLLASVSPGAPWQRVTSSAPITGVSRLMCLPATQCEVRLNDAVRLDLWGAPIETLVPFPTQPVYESIAEVFVPPAGFDADVRVMSGRVYLQGSKPNARARVRLGDDIFDITMDDQAEVAVEVMNSSMRVGTPPATRLFAAGTIGVIRGKITLRENLGPDQAMSAAPGANVRTWNDMVPNTGESQNLGNVSTAQLSRKPPLSKLARERQSELEALTKRLERRLIDPQKDLKLAVAEVAADQSPWGRVVAIYHQAALDDMPPLLDAMDDAQANEARPAALYALQHWLCREPGRDAKLAAALIAQKSFSPAQAEQAVALFHDFSAEDIKKPATYATLIDLLMDDLLPLRELAMWQLRTLDPDGAAAITYYSTDPRDKRERAQQEWKKRIQANGLPPTKPR